MDAVTGARRLSPGWWSAAVLACCLIATLNAGGYRFGVADQAFYLPAIQRHLEPASFPRDRLIIDDQDRLNVFTALIARGARATPISLEAWFATVYAGALLLLFGAAGRLGLALGYSPWAVAAAAAALTLRHRVGVTGVNTLESYGHPRMLAFAIGLWAVVAVLKGRTAMALGITAVAFIVHPTTALWFGVWVGTAVLLGDRQARPWLAAGALAGAAVASWAILAGPLREQLVTMDAEWRGVIGQKDYLFPHTWTLSAWVMAAAYVAVVGAVFGWRRRLGLTVAREGACLGGLAVLLLLFVASVPATAAGIALAVQFQVSRIFWMFDVVGTLYLAGALADGARAGLSANRRAAAVALFFALAACSRGAYVKWVEHPERPLVQWSLPVNDWQDAAAWLRRTPVDSLVLANPAHAWRFGTSLRVSAGRDVVLEEVKDTAMAMYSRRVAMHVLERIRAIGSFDALTTDDVRALAARYGITYVVSERPFDLPVAYRNGTFVIYRTGG